MYGYRDFSPSRSRRSVAEVAPRNRSPSDARWQNNRRTSALDRKWVHRSMGDLAADTDTDLDLDHHISHPRLQSDFYQDLYKKYPRAFHRRHDAGRQLFNAKPHVRFKDEVNTDDDRSDITLHSTRSERPVTNWDKEVGLYMKYRPRSRQCLTSAEPSEYSGSGLSVKQRLHLNSQTLNRLLYEKSPLRKRFSADFMNYEGRRSVETNGLYSAEGKENRQQTVQRRVYQRKIESRSPGAARYRSQSELGLSRRSPRSRPLHRTYPPQSPMTSSGGRTQHAQVESLLADTDLKIDTLLEELSMKMSSPESPPDSAIDVDTPSIQSTVSADRGGHSNAVMSNALVVEIYEDGYDSSQTDLKVNFNLHSEHEPDHRKTLQSSSSRSIEMSASPPSGFQFVLHEDGSRTRTRGDKHGHHVDSQPVSSSSEKSESGNSSLTTLSEGISEMDKIVQNFVNSDDGTETFGGQGQDQGQGLLQFYLDISHNVQCQSKSDSEPSSQVNNEPSEQISDKTGNTESTRREAPALPLVSELDASAEAVCDSGARELIANSSASPVDWGDTTARPDASVHVSTADTDSTVIATEMTVDGTQVHQADIDKGTDRPMQHHGDSDVDSGIGQSSVDSKHVSDASTRGRQKERGVTLPYQPVKGDHSILPSRADVDSSIIHEVNLGALSQGLSHDLYGRGGKSRVDDEQDDTEPRDEATQITEEERKLAERFRRRRSPSPYILRCGRYSAGASRPSSTSSMFSDVKVVDISISNDPLDTSNSSIEGHQCDDVTGKEDQQHSDKEQTCPSYSEHVTQPTDIQPPSVSRECSDDVFVPSVSSHSQLPDTSHELQQLPSTGSSPRNSHHSSEELPSLAQSCQRKVAVDASVDHLYHEQQSGLSAAQIPHDQKVEENLSSTPMEQRKRSSSSYSYSVSSVSSVETVRTNSSHTGSKHSIEHIESESRQSPSLGAPTVAHANNIKTESWQAQQASSKNHVPVGQTHGIYKPSLTSPRVKDKKRKLRNIFKNKKGSFTPNVGHSVGDAGQYMPVTFSGGGVDEASGQAVNNSGGSIATSNSNSNGTSNSSSSVSVQEACSADTVSDDSDPGYATVGAVSKRSATYNAPPVSDSGETDMAVQRERGNTREVTHQSKRQLTAYQVSVLVEDKDVEELLHTEEKNTVAAKPLYIEPKTSRNVSLGSSQSSHSAMERPTTVSGRLEPDAKHREALGYSAVNDETSDGTGYQSSSVSCDVTTAREVAAPPPRTKRGRGSLSHDSEQTQGSGQPTGNQGSHYSNITDDQTNAYDENLQDLYAKVDPSKRSQTLDKQTVGVKNEGPPLPDRQYQSNLEDSRTMSSSKSSLSDKMGGVKSATKSKWKAVRKAMSLEKGLDQAGTCSHKKWHPGGAPAKGSHSGFLGMKKAPSLKSLTSLFSRKKKKKLSADDTDASSDLTLVSSAHSGGLRGNKQPHWSSCQTLSVVDSSSPNQPKGKLLQLNPDGTQLIELMKPAQGTIGFFIAQGSAEYKHGIFVSRFNAGATELTLTGLLGVGDEILEINGQHVCHLTLDAVYQLMASSHTLLLRVFPVIARQDV